MIKITEEMQQRVDKAFEEKKYCVWATTSDELDDPTACSCASMKSAAKRF